MKDASKIRVLTAAHVKQSSGGVAIKAGVRAGLAIDAVTSVTSVNAKMTPVEALDITSAKMFGP